MLTLPELKERLVKHYDEVTLLEILNITAEDLVEAFVDRIEEKQEQLTQDVSE